MLHLPFASDCSADARAAVELLKGDHLSRSDGYGNDDADVADQRNDFIRQRSAVLVEQR